MGSFPYVSKCFGISLRALECASSLDGGRRETGDQHSSPPGEGATPPQHHSPQQQQQQQHHSLCLNHQPTSSISPPQHHHESLVSALTLVSMPPAARAGLGRAAVRAAPAWVIPSPLAGSPAPAQPGPGATHRHPPLINTDHIARPCIIKTARGAATATLSTRPAQGYYWDLQTWRMQHVKFVIYLLSLGWKLQSPPAHFCRCLSGDPA